MTNKLPELWVATDIDTERSYAYLSEPQLEEGEFIGKGNLGLIGRSTVPPGHKVRYVAMDIVDCRPKQVEADAPPVPGWRVDATGCGRVVDENGVTVAISYKDESTRLVAAAPELLEALDTLTAVIGLTPVSGNKEALQEAFDQARSAIRKAKGCSQPVAAQVEGA